MSFRAPKHVSVSTETQNCFSRNRNMFRRATKTHFAGVAIFVYRMSNMAQAVLIAFLEEENDRCIETFFLLQNVVKGNPMG